MNKETLAQEIRRVSKLTGTFTLRSGKVADTYFDKYLFESDPRLLAAIAAEMARLVPAGIEILCGLEMGGIPVVTALSQLTGLPAAFARKQAKTYGTQKYAEGPPLAGRKIVLIEDVVSSGGAILNTTNMLRDDGVTVDRAICVIDRRSPEETGLEDAGVELTHVFTMAEIEGA